LVKKCSGEKARKILIKAAADEDERGFTPEHSSTTCCATHQTTNDKTSLPIDQVQNRKKSAPKEKKVFVLPQEGRKGNQLYGRKQKKKDGRGGNNSKHNKGLNLNKWKAFPNEVEEKKANRKNNTQRGGKAKDHQ